MLFVEPVFLFLFLPAVLLLHSVVGRGGRNAVLLAASLAFYAWGEGVYVAVMICSIAFNHGVARLLDRPSKSQRKTRPLLVFGVAANLAALAFFKYANFIVDNINVALPAAQLPLAPIHLPIGISFFTFQAMAYIIDVARGTSTAQPNPIRTGLYIALFPQLIAGPIVRYSQVAAELEERRIDLDGLSEGVRRFIIGLAKKMFIANTAAAYADQILGLDPEYMNPPIAWLAVVCYSLQIYFDFSGYSDMAIGLGKMFGFQFPENFDYPYVSQSVTEFWRRWHISLSTWFRDYLYIPLGGSRGSGVGTYRNLLIVFVLCGFWHGASWNFLVWGLWHGILLVMERLGFASVLQHLPRPLRHIYSLLVVAVGWVIFRTESLAEARHIIVHLFGLAQGNTAVHTAGDYIDVQTILVLVVGVIAATPVTPWLAERLGRRGTVGASSLVHHATAVAALLVLLIGSASLVAAETYNPFIYFRF